MSKLFIYVIAVMLILLTPKLGSAQKYSTKNKKALEAFEQARVHYDYGRNDQAISTLEKALKFDEKFVDAYILRGYLYLDKEEYDKCIADFKKVIEVEPKMTIAYYNIAQAEIRAGRYEDAVNHLNKFLSFDDNSPIAIKKAENLLESAKFTQHALANPVPFNPINLGENINTKDSEYWPTISADNQTLIITRRELKQIVQGTKIEREDFYIAKRMENGEWGEARNVGPPINTSGNEGALALSPDGQFVFFVACEREDGKGSCDIYIAQKSGDLWKKPLNLGSPVNSYAWDSSPSFSSDGKTLYFSSARGGGSKKNMDIYETVFDGSRWSKPVPVEGINTEADELSPFIHPDGSTIYFASSGFPGMGGLDLFYSRKDADGKWSTPVNMGYPINTNGNEQGLVVNANGDLAYIASQREGGFGGQDIYTFELYEEARPKKVTYAKGRVYDVSNGDPLKAMFELIDIETHEVVVRSSSDEKDGSFLVCLPINKEYALNVSKEGYAFYSESFSLTEYANEAYQINVPMQPLMSGSKVVLKNVFFETNKYDLKPSSQAELNKLVNFLKNNPTTNIQIGGHTDNVGNKEDNRVLSENRARAVFQYLIDNGIVETRLSYKGYGDTQPIATNDTAEGRQQNRRTEFEIVSVQ